MGLSVSRLLSGLFGKKEMRACLITVFAMSFHLLDPNLFFLGILMVTYVIFQLMVDIWCHSTKVGLDAAGKTTILYKLKLGEIVTTIPTIGSYLLGI